MTNKHLCVLIITNAMIFFTTFYNVLLIIFQFFTNTYHKIKWDLKVQISSTHTLCKQWNHWHCTKPNSVNTSRTRSVWRVFQGVSVFAGWRAIEVHQDLSHLLLFKITRESLNSAKRALRFTLHSQISKAGSL